MKRLSLISAFLLIPIVSAALLAQRGGPPPVPPAAAPMLDAANKLVDAVNKKDAAALQKMAAPDAVYLDEDGHAAPIMVWINKLTMGAAPKQMMITQNHGQTWDNAGWVSFNYTLAETYQGQPKTLKGTASIVLKKAAGGDWQITLVHGALEQHVPNLSN
jgi:ketosteroid isomerase-like protein